MTRISTILLENFFHQLLFLYQSAATVVCELMKFFNMLNSSRHIQNNTIDDDEEEEIVLGFSAEFDTFPIILAIFIGVVNFFVLFLNARVRSLRTMTNFVLGSLAFSDFLSGVVGIPFYVACSAIQERPVCGVTQVLTRFFSISIVLHLLLVSIDRHIAIIYAIRYQTLVTRRRIYHLLLLVWVSATFVALIPLSWIGLDVNVNEDFDGETVRFSIVYNIFCMVLFFAVPLITMTFCYVKIFLALKQQLRAIQQNNIPSFRRNKRRFHARERRAALIFMAMITIYIFCWLPYFIQDFQHQLGEDFFTLPVPIEYAMFYYPKFLNSLLNPLLYVFCKHDFRQAACATLGRTLRDDRTSLSLQNTHGKGSHQEENGESHLKT